MRRKELLPFVTKPCAGNVLAISCAAPMLSLRTPRKLFEKARARFTPKAPAVAPHLDLGRRGERLAAEYLCERGYELVASNFTLSVGRDRRGAVVRNEIDLVAYDGPVLCFVEVK